MVQTMHASLHWTVFPSLLRCNTAASWKSSAKTMMLRFVASSSSDEEGEEEDEDQESPVVLELESEEDDPLIFHSPVKRKREPEPYGHRNQKRFRQPSLKRSLVKEENESESDASESETSSSSQSDSESTENEKTVDTRLARLAKSIFCELDSLLSEDVRHQQEEMENAMDRELKERNAETVTRYAKSQQERTDTIAKEIERKFDSAALFPPAKLVVPKIEPLPRGCFFDPLKTNFPVEITRRPKKEGTAWDPKNDYALLRVVDKFGAENLLQICDIVNQYFSVDPKSGALERFRKLRPENPSRDPLNISENFAYMFCTVCYKFHCVTHIGFNRTTDGLLKRGAPDRHREAKKLVDGGPCAYDCYKRNWEKDDLIIEEVDWSEEEKAIFAKSLETVGTSFCLIKLGLLGKTCNQVHEFYMSEEWPKFKKRLDAKRAQVLGSSWSTSTSLRNTAKEGNHSYYACNCVRSCSAPTCICKRRGTPCEKFCSCPTSCSARYRGCSCKVEKSQMTCGKNCPCRESMRECDPSLCLSCDAGCAPSDLKGPRRCQNVHMLYGNASKKTLLGYSTLAVAPRMFGLFAGEHIKKGDFVMEYAGKLFDEEYSDQASMYLFDIIEHRAENENLIDAHSMGNKTRFINHSSRHANVYSGGRFVNGQHRMAFYARRDIKPGEELFFNYGDNYWKVLNVKPTEEAKPL